MARSLTEFAPPVAREPDGGRPEVVSLDARTGEVVKSLGPESSPQKVAQVCVTAEEAGGWLRSLDRSARAEVLRACAASLELACDEIVAVADRETALGRARLTGELARTSGQLRLFAEVVEDGSHLDVAIDTAQPGAQPFPRPDLRRTKVPLGVVAVFGASNFPLAFSVAGGDTASALAAGCPVVVKAHPGHPATSVLVAARLQMAVRDCGGPEGLVGLVHGVSAGRTLVQDPRVAAVGFTGSVPGGRALFDLACSRTRPIPFYGELGSLNPLVVRPPAAGAREELGERIADSTLLGAGQFCTKPGLLAVPRGDDGDAVVAGLRRRASETPAAHLLGEGIRTALVEATPRLVDGTSVLVRDPGADRTVGATVVELSAAAVVSRPDLLEEHFGPFAVVVRYDGHADLLPVLDALEPCLVATVHATYEDHAAAAGLLPTLASKAGRIVWNGFPTGVQVSWAMTHGGPYPATTSPLHTSVGAGAIARWLRPVTYQDVPEDLLPADLVEPVVPHRVDGCLQIPGQR
jgi:NADP-dependent aldehyde dehydrogenase